MTHARKIEHHSVGSVRQDVDMSVPALLLIALVAGTVMAFVRPSSGAYRARSELHMGGKQAKFGIFSPAVYGAKALLGDQKLNKIRGKAISIHSQVITDFCKQYGASNLRLKLIKKAKVNGDVLGFLV